MKARKRSINCEAEGEASGLVRFQNGSQFTDN